MSTGNSMTMRLPKLLIADDQPDVLTALRLLLKGAGIEAESATSPQAVVEALSARDFDLVLMDLNYTRDTTSGLEGLDLISRIRALDEVVPVVAMTAWGGVELAVEAMKQGINDFILKPWENARLLDVLRSQIEAGRIRRKQAIFQSARQQELIAARRVQQSLLPGSIPAIEGCQVSTHWKPALEVSGDYFDVFRTSPKRTAICIGDVMGKGMSAALLMSNLQALVKSFSGPQVSPADLCAQLNRTMCEHGNADKIITFFYSQFDSGNKRLSYVNAGHNPPLLLRANGELLRLGSGGALLGAFAESAYEQGEIELKSGDRLVCYTDGMTEASNQAGEEFGEDRLRMLLIENARAGSEQLRNAVVNAVETFSEGSFQDDATLIVIAVD